MPAWAQALLIGGGGVVIYLALLKRLRRAHRGKDIPDIVLREENDERGPNS